MALEGHPLCRASQGYKDQSPLNHSGCRGDSRVELHLDRSLSVHLPAPSVLPELLQLRGEGGGCGERRLTVQES